MKNGLSLAILMLILFNSSFAIQVSGPVWGVWNADDNPYEVVEDLWVPPGSTLVIEPGCFIDFQGYYRFIVDTSATLQAIGTQTDSIIFTTSDTITGWLGLSFLSADSNSILSYCVIEWGNALVNIVLMCDHCGGGIYIFDTDMEISHCLVRNNRANLGLGGGIFCSFSNILISDNVILSNNCSHGGSGICCWDSQANITGNVIENNRTYAPGGGVSCSNSDIIISNNTFKNNHSGNKGGGIDIDHCTALIEYNEFVDNFAFSCGGGIFTIYSTQTLAFNLFVNNVSAIYGGALDCCYSSNYIINNTFWGNSAGEGGGLWLYLDESDTLMNNIIWGNTATVSDDNVHLGEGDSSQLIYSDIGGGWPGEGNIDADPLFCNPEDGNFFLTENSPCVGTGFNSANMGAFGIGCEANEIFEDHQLIPEAFSLSQNYPNPFNASTAINYTLPKTTEITLDIYNLLGGKVETLYDGIQSAGTHTIIWNAYGFSSGIYFYKLTAEEYLMTQKMMLLK